VPSLERLNLPPAFPDPEPLQKRAAVAVVVGPAEDLLFIRRAERPGDPWSGDMAFPGGHAEPEDASPRATAERETREEVGLDLGDAAFLGALPVLVSPARIIGAGFGIHPYVFRVPRWPEFVPSAEVAAIHHLSLARILAGEGRGEFRYVGYGIERDFPCLRLDGTFVWGLTLRVVDELVERLRAGQERR
jgi:8-oxo-dGTP pyrophosphatase MutT (NUDIX family)